jgi:DNA polymerase-3 subunit beta
MRFQTTREGLLRPLQQVCGVVERKHTLPILSNVLIELAKGQGRFVASDSEVEMQALMLAPDSQEGDITVSAAKLLEIVKSLPEGAALDVKLSGDRLQMQAGRSRYTLATLSARDFPTAEVGDIEHRVTLSRGLLKGVLEAAAFAMASQDVRYYLNGMLFETHHNGLRVVATDGHRLAIADSMDGLEPAGDNASEGETRAAILPKKGVQMLQRALDNSDEDVTLGFTRNQMRVDLGDTVLISKLIDGRYPDYEAVVPLAADHTVHVDRSELTVALQRAAILSNEKYRGVQLEISGEVMKISSRNPEQEHAEEEVAIRSSIDKLVVGFNVNYLLDALNAVGGTEVVLCLRDGNSSALIRQPEGHRIRQVVMPLRL